MWARKPGKGDAPIERLCNDCHNKESVGKDRQAGSRGIKAGKTG